MPLILLLLLGADLENVRHQRACSILPDMQHATVALLELVESRNLEASDAATLEDALEELSSDSFRRRETAMQRLIRLGIRVQPRLEAELKQTGPTTQPERRARIQAALNAINRIDAQPHWAAAVLLKRAPPADVAVSRRLLQSLPAYPSYYLAAPIIDAAMGHLRRTPAEQRWLKAMFQQGAPRQRAAALVFLAALSEDATPATRHLQSRQPELQLASARVFTTTSPEAAVKVLLELHSHVRPDLRAESNYLLRALHEAAVGKPPARRMTTEQWRAWASRTPAKPLAPSAAFRWGMVQLGMREDFNREQAEIKKTYGSFSYEASVPAKAAVRGGKLLLDGSHAEGDQRLAISAMKFAGVETMQDAFSVEAGLGGRQGNPVAWHVGVSVGRAKFLFHPDYPGGAFRVEDVQTHASFVPNTNMNFTPQANVIHKMRLVVEPSRTGGAKVGVVVIDGASGRRFQQQVALSKKQIGEINRIGLERSGRTGGAAVFEYLDISAR